MIEAQHLTSRYRKTVAVDDAYRSAGLLRPGTTLVVLAVYAAIALGATATRVAHRDA